MLNIILYIYINIILYLAKNTGGIVGFRDQYKTMCRADPLKPTELNVDTSFKNSMEELASTESEPLDWELTCTPSTLLCTGNPINMYAKSTTAPHKIHYSPTLFNLYPIRYFMLGRNFTLIPHLTLQQTHFNYFLKNMDSLINIWEDEGVNPESDYCFLFDQENKGGKILITNSKFELSRFCKGLLSYNYWHYKYENSNWNYYSEQENTRDNEDDLKYSIIIQNSEFKRLNILNPINKAKLLLKDPQISAVIDPVIDMAFIEDNITMNYNFYLFFHRGIVLNLQGFPGSVYISNSLFL